MSNDFTLKSLRYVLHVGEFYMLIISVKLRMFTYSETSKDQPCWFLSYQDPTPGSGHMTWQVHQHRRWLYPRLRKHQPTIVQWTATHKHLPPAEQRKTTACCTITERDCVTIGILTDLCNPHFINGYLLSLSSCDIPEVTLLLSGVQIRSFSSKFGVGLGKGFE